MLDAHTATRSFRELQYDLHELLTVLYAITTDSVQDASVMVEAKWSDGSVDVVPAVSLVKALVANAYPHVRVGDSLLQVIRKLVATQGGKYYVGYPSLKITGMDGLSARFESLGGADVEQVLESCVVTDITAATVVLDGAVAISYVEATDSLSSRYLGVSRGISADYVKSDDVDVESVDLSHLSFNAPMMVRPSGEILDGSYVFSMPVGSNRGSTVYDRIVVRGNMAAFRTDNDSPYLGGTVYVEVPVIDADTGGLVYTATRGDRIPDNGTAPFALNSETSLVSIYPKRFLVTDTVGADSTEATFRLVMPVSDDSDRIVRVENPTGVPVRVCNIWRFQQRYRDITGMDRYARISALNYVVLPRYSRIDFLFVYRIDGSVIEASMIPMKNLDSEVSDE